jgi:hypothetical protein
MRTVLATSASTAVLLIVTASTPQGIYSDAAIQVKTVEQTMSGESPRLNVWTRPDYGDLTRDAAEPLVVWAPGTPLAIAPLMYAGLPAAAAVRVVAALAILAGAAGWSLWFAGFGPDPRLALLLALLLPWTRLASNALFSYGSDILAFAAVPWVLAAALAAVRTDSLARYAGAGLLAGLLYVVKDSAAFAAAGVIFWFATLAARQTVARRHVVTAAIAAAVPAVALTILNRQGGSANLLTATLAPSLHGSSFVHATAFPALAAADLDSVLRFALMHPVRGVTANPLWLSALALPAGIWLLWIALRASTTGPHAELSRSVLVISVAAMAAVFTLSDAVSAEARHLAPAGLCILPLAAVELHARWRTGAGMARPVIAGGAMAFVAVPLAYGPVSVAAKAWRTPTTYRSASSGLYNPLFSTADSRAGVEALEAGRRPSGDIWYLTEPMTSLDLRGRAIVRHADFMTVEALRRDRFVAAGPLRVRALLPPRFEANGKGAAIRGSFPQATNWTRQGIPGSEYDCWTADLAAPTARR